MTCEASDEGRAWWLTRESGRRPQCVDPDRCGCDSCSASLEERRKSYFVCKVTTWQGKAKYVFVVFGQMSKETVEVAEARVLPCLIAALLKRSWAKVKALERIVGGLDSGQFSTLACCGCQAGWKTCSVCEAMPPAQWRFTSGGQYEGFREDVKPTSQCAWFFCVTHSVGRLSEDSDFWLVCPQERSVYRELREIRDFKQ